MTLTFATEQQNGVLLYTGDKQHLAVELFRGRIRVSYDVGNYPVRKVVTVTYLLDTLKFSYSLLYFVNMYY